MPCPIILESISAGAPVPILEVGFGTVSFGREPENSIVIDSGSVSRVHGVLVEAGTQWVFRDNNSTNGSWINGVQVYPGQLKLVRVGDTLQIADFPVRISPSEQEASTELPDDRPTLLVFFGDRFKWEFAFADEASVFNIGGSQADLLIDGEPPGSLQCTISNEGGRLELATSEPTTKVIVAGTTVTGRVSLSDSSMIEIGPYRLLINDSHSKTEVSSERPFEVAGHPESSAELTTEAPLYNQNNLPAHLQEKKTGTGEWMSEASRRRKQDSRSYVFGSLDSAEGGLEVTGVNPSLSGNQAFELNISQRFGNSDSGNLKSGGGVAEKMILFAGLIIILLIIGAIFYLVTKF